ncbi:histidine kinase, partial [Streptomyces botrytidirepellens]
MTPLPWRRWTRAVLGRRALLRWVHLVLGGALLMPYFLLTTVILGSVVRSDDLLTSLPWQLLAFAAALPLAALTALFPLVRPLEAMAARALCGLPESAELAAGPAASWDARRRTALWYALHLAVGGVVSGLTLAVPPAAVLLMALPVTGTSYGADLGRPGAFDGGRAVLAPAAGALLLA